MTIVGGIAYGSTVKIVNHLLQLSVQWLYVKLLSLAIEKLRKNQRFKSVNTIIKRQGPNIDCWCYEEK